MSVADRGAVRWQYNFLATSDSRSIFVSPRGSGGFVQDFFLLRWYFMVGTTFTTHGWARDFGVVSRPVGVIPPKQVASARGVEFIEGWLEIGFGRFFLFSFLYPTGTGLPERLKIHEGIDFLCAPSNRKVQPKMVYYIIMLPPAGLLWWMGLFSGFNLLPLEVRQTAWWQLRFIRNGKWHKVTRNGAQ